MENLVYITVDRCYRVSPSRKATVLLMHPHQIVCSVCSSNSDSLPNMRTDNE